MADILSEIVAKRNLGGESVSVALSSEVPVAIGTSRGKATQVSAPEAVTHLAGHVDALANSDIREIISVNVSSVGTGRSFTENVHFTLQSSGSLDFSNAPALTPPAVDAVATIATGGSFSSTGDIAWAITCFDGDSNETTVGTYIKKTLAAADLSKSFKISFARPVGASGACRIYRTQNFDAGGEPIFTSGSVVYFSTTGTSLTDTGASGTSQVAPSSNTAKDRPGIGASYYVNYTYAVFTYQTPKLYSTIDAIITDHGFGSDLANAGILAIGRNGKGNEAPGVVLVAVENDAIGDYQAALTELEKYPYGNYIVCLRQNSTLDESGRLHAENQSADSVKRERYYVTAPIPGAAVGDSGTPGTIIHKLGTFLGSRRVVFPVVEGNVLTATQWQQIDGSYLYDVNITNGNFLAIAYAARKCAQPDVAEDLTGKQIIGFKFLTTALHYSKLEKENIITAGGSVIEDISQSLIVNRSITTSSASTEDQTLSILSAEDEVRRQTRKAAEPFRGKKINVSRLEAFKSNEKQVLDILVQKEVIEEYADLETLQDPLNKQKMTVKFRYKPMYSAIWIDISYGFIASQ